MELKLPYGLRDEKLLTIEDVDSGLACKCVCPGCKKQLIARKGAVKAHHFAHYQSEDCLSGFETALHKLSKEIIAASKTFTTPVLYYPYTNYVIYEETEIFIENVKLETKLGEFIPDIVIETKGKKLLIEITVNNSVNCEKLQRIESKNLPAIEIDAKYLMKRLYIQKDFGLKDNLFQTELVSGTIYKSWLHNPKIRAIKLELKKNYAELKKVKSFKTEEIGYYNYIDECPLEKNAWKSGRNKGKPYASIDYDCVTCIYCIAIDYKHPYRYAIPQTVHCLGYLKNDFKELVKALR